MFVVTPRAQANGLRGYHKVDREIGRGSTVAEVWYNLPLNGEWSDVTATFRVEREGSALEPVLQEIHVF